ncbi:MAG: hypothetical protein BMS9Abin29_1611 [Gemmatimonadota bacterium]|nr:MAG: hypothetical protein BMS9Abin29_1611 [Gemmatimonadota bacterium]
MKTTTLKLPFESLLSDAAVGQACQPTAGRTGVALVMTPDSGAQNVPLLSDGRDYLEAGGLDGPSSDTASTLIDSAVAGIRSR